MLGQCRAKHAAHGGAGRPKLALLAVNAGADRAVGGELAALAVDAGVDAAVAFANELVQSSTLYELDQYWILLYQLFFHDRIGNPYEDEPTFEILKKYDVQFVNPPARQSKAEDYCFHVSHPFIKKEDRLSFQDYLEKN